MVTQEIKKVELNNKSRKGKYFYLKEEGKHPKYIKIRTHDEKKELKQLIKHLNTKKNTTTAYTKTIKQIKETKKQLNKSVKTIRRKGDIQHAITKGTTATITPNALNTNAHETRESNKRLLEKLITNKDLTEDILKEENLQKIKYRYEHQIEIKDATGNTLINTRTLNKTLKETIDELNKLVKE